MKKNKKYTIMLNPPDISDIELEKYKDFNHILEKSKNHKRWDKSTKIYLTSGIILSALLLVAGWWYKGNFAEVKQKSNLQASKNIIITTKKIIQHDPAKKSPTSPINIDTNNLPTRGAEHGHITRKKERLLNKKDHVESGYSEAIPKGGYPALFEYFKSNLNYPEKAREKGIQGTVMVEFYILANGKADQIEVLQGVHPDLDNEAKRLIAQMPAWEPAKIDGTTLSVRQTLPIIFNIEKLK